MGSGMAGGSGAGSPCDSVEGAAASNADGDGSSLCDRLEDDVVTLECRSIRADVIVVDDDGGAAGGRSHPAVGDGAAAVEPIGATETAPCGERELPRQDVPTTSMAAVLTTMTETRLIRIERSFGSMVLVRTHPACLPEHPSRPHPVEDDLRHERHALAVRDA